MARMFTDVSVRQLTRGVAGRQTPEELLKLIYSAWLLAFVLKVAGSSWDVAWHFKWLRDDLAIPHLLNSAGTAIAMTLVGLHWYTGYGVTKSSKRFIEAGMAVFMVAIPVDLINHEVNGLDITSWSPSHALLYIGTALMLTGVIMGRRRKDVMLAVFFGFFLENWHFPAQHQEYGVYELKSWDEGRPYAEPSLIEFAANQMGREVDREMVKAFSLPVSDWVYPLWTAIGAMFVLVIARRVVGKRWTATAIASGYVLYRVVTGVLLDVADFPLSAFPYFLIAGAVCIDLAFWLIPERPIVAALLTVGAAYTGLVMQDAFLEAPPYALNAWPVAAASLAVLWYIQSLLGKTSRRTV